MSDLDALKAAFIAAGDALRAGSPAEKPALQKKFSAAHKTWEAASPPQSPMPHVVVGIPPVPGHDRPPPKGAKYIKQRAQLKAPPNERPLERAYRLALNAKFIAEDWGGTDEEVDAAHARFCTAAENLRVSR